MTNDRGRLTDYETQGEGKGETGRKTEEQTGGNGEGGDEGIDAS
ncbi:MAG: hypothetical protein SWQ30_09350 [Thermodesulfobacteriota bacterium]|nr:hypothetical protein [Thermodesulfobacteriota bacterium]